MSLEVTGTKDNFQTEVLNASEAVIVDFWADWCVPCKMVAPVLEKIAEKYQGKIKVVKVNVDQESELAMEHNIVSIPTLMVYQNGEIVKKQLGAASQSVLEDMVKEYV